MRRDREGREHHRTDRHPGRGAARVELQGQSERIDRQEQGAEVEHDGADRRQGPAQPGAPDDGRSRGAADDGDAGRQAELFPVDGEEGGRCREQQERTGRRDEHRGGAAGGPVTTDRTRGRWRRTSRVTLHASGADGPRAGVDMCRSIAGVTGALPHRAGGGGSDALPHRAVDRERRSGRRRRLEIGPRCVRRPWRWRWGRGGGRDHGGLQGFGVATTVPDHAVAFHPGRPPPPPGAS